jgi:diguanylate cyclase (GGDEF)-like protein/PAS domain S-box-containing protein
MANAPDPPLGEPPYQLLAEMSSDVVYLLDRDDRILWVSPSVTNVLGWSSEALRGRPLTDLVHPEDFGLILEAREHPRDGVVAVNELRYRRADGGYLWVSGQARSVMDADGVPVGRVGALRDIDGQVRERLAAEESHERFRLAMDNSAIGMCLVAPTGMFEMVNGAFCAMLGRDRDDLMSLTWQDLTHPDDLDVDLALVQELLDDERQTYRLRKRYLSRDGSVIWGDLSVSCMRNGDRSVRYFIGQIVDVTDETRAREALASSEERFRMLAENSSDIVFHLAPDNTYVWVSPSVRDILGWDPDDMVGRSGADYIHPDDFPAVVRSREHPLAGLAVVEEFRFRDYRGEYRWVSGRSREIVDREGAVAGRVVALRDVDALVEAGRLVEAERELLSRTLNSLLDPHVLLRAVRDENGGIVDFEYVSANDAACAYNRMTHDELVGARLLDLLPGHAGSGLLELYAGAIDRGVPVVLDDHEFTNTILGTTTRSDVRGIGVGDALSLTWRDVTDRHDVVEATAASERQFRLLAENSSDVVIRRRGDEILWASPSLESTLGWLPREWVGQSLYTFLHPDERVRLRENSTRIEAGSVVHARYRIKDSRQRYHWIDTSASQFHDEHGRVDGVVASFRVVDRAVDLELELERRAHFDDLTGVLKRDEALIRLGELISRPSPPGVESAVLFCDLDDFKAVNDHWGHQAGDELLRVVAERMRRTVRGGDIVARLGGDEFLVVLDGLRSLEEAVRVAEKIREHVREDVTAFGLTISATMSIGVTLIGAAEDADALIALADGAMYRAKEEGRNRVVAVEGRRRRVRE